MNSFVGVVDEEMLKIIELVVAKPAQVNNTNIRLSIIAFSIDIASRSSLVNISERLVDMFSDKRK